MNDLPDAVDDVTQVLEKMGCTYAIMGGLAARAYGVPRATYDVDLTVALERERLAEFYAAITKYGYTVPEPFDSGWVDEVAGMPLVKVRMYLQARQVDVDIFLAECRFQKELLSRRRKHKHAEIQAWFVSPEDLVLLKLVAGRPRDIGDIHDVRFVNDQLDEAYMRKWAAHLGISDKLEAMLATPPQV